MISSLLCLGPQDMQGLVCNSIISASLILLSEPVQRFFPSPPLSAPSLVSQPCVPTLLTSVSPVLCGRKRG